MSRWIRCFGVGERVDLTITDPDLKQARGDGTRYLFFTAQQGLHDATVQSTPRFVTTFKRWAVPNMEVGSVRFTGHGYVAAGFPPGSGPRTVVFSWT